MSRILVPSLLAVGVLAGGSAKAPSLQAAHRFELVSAAEALNADGSPEACLFGRYEPGTPVLLLSDDDSRTCSVLTGRVGASEYGNGDCSVLIGKERCTGSYQLGVIGSHGAYRRVKLQPLPDESTRAALGQVIAKSRVVETASSRWKDALQELSYDATIVDAVTWPGLHGSPVLVRLKVNGDDIQGPWVAIAQGEAEIIVGPFSMRSPTAFTLDGRNYLSFRVAICNGCGGVGTEVYAVEAGKLRHVLESFANAN